MGENSKIDWTDHTFNPWTGCTKVSPACDHCYAEGWAKRSGHVTWGAGQPRRRTSEANWSKPIKWNRQAEADAVRKRVFCASLADVFDAEVDPIWRENLFTLIDLTPALDWLLLTKRPKLAADYFNGEATPPNVWIGTTVENQKMADVRVPHLMSINAPVRFLSMEPLLEHVDLHFDRFPDWVIVGGESGHGWRNMDPQWAENIKTLCKIADVPFFMKQMAGKLPIPSHLVGQAFPSPNITTENDDE